MSTIASLIALMDPSAGPYSEDRETLGRIAHNRQLTETGLLQLADLKRKQAAEQEMFAAIQQNPALAQQFFGGGGGPVLGSLQTPPGGPPGGGPMTQQTTMPGQPPSAPQVVPGGQNLSQFATQGAPQSTIASLGPQPQVPMQPPRNPVLEMAQRSPQAAFLMQQQMEAREAQQFKMQEQRLKMGTAAVEHVGQLAQGVTDQASLDAMRADLVSSGLGKYAAQLPQFYAKGAMEPFIEKAKSVLESQKLQVQDLTAQAALMKARREQANIPNYTGDAQLDALIYTKMKDQPPGTMPGQDIVDAAIQQREKNKLAVSERQGIQAAEIERTEKPLEGEAGKAVSDLTTLRKLSDDVAALRKDDFTGPIVGRTGYLREQAGRMDQQETAFRTTIKNMTDILARLRSGAAIPPDDMARLEQLVPSVNDHPETFRAKLQSFQRAVEQQRETRLQVGTTGRQRLREETTPTTPRVGEKPASQPTSQGHATFDRADFLKWRTSTGKSGNPTAPELEDYFQSKGLKRR